MDVAWKATDLHQQWSKIPHRFFALSYAVLTGVRANDQRHAATEQHQNAQASGVETWQALTKKLGDGTDKLLDRRQKGLMIVESLPQDAQQMPPNHTYALHWSNTPIENSCYTSDQHIQRDHPKSVLKFSRLDAQSASHAKVCGWTLPKPILSKFILL